MPLNINPRKLRGPWAEGFALDVHTTASTFLGYNAYGHPEFHTARSPLGDHLYRLKNRGDKSAIGPIVETVVGFLRKWQLQLDAIVPVPPSNTARRNQPVIALATAISEQTGISLCVSCVSKVKSTAQLKNIFERAEREQILADAFSVDRDKTAGRRLLLLDNLYRSGATAGTITRLLLRESAASSVYLLTLTKTRSKQ